MKMLENNYFVINDIEKVEDGSVRFHIGLKADHKVYEGHFPGNPVSPGVCSIEMIRECTEKIVEKNLFISEVNLCRFITVLTPAKSQGLQIIITPTINEETVKVVASIVDENETVYVTFKGQFIVK